MRASGWAPTRRFAACVGLAAPVWLLSSSATGLIVAIVACAAVLALAAYDIVTMPGRASIVVERRFPPTIGVGDRVEGEYVIGSEWPVALHGELHDRLPAAVVPGSPSPISVRLAPHSAVTIPRPATGAIRGDHSLGPVALRLGGRLGLVTRTLRYDPGDSVHGVPSVAAVRLYRLATVQRRMRAVGVRAVRPRGEGSTFANLRDYAVGDDPRHIDWKASARRARLIAREFSLEQGQQVLIVVDAGRLMTQLAGDRARFEYALSSAVVLADVAVHSGDAVGVVVFDDIVRRYVAPARGVAAVRSVREALSSAEARLVEPDYAGAFRTIATRQRNRALIVVFSDVLDVRASNTLIAHLTVSAGRHLPLVVALRNDDVAHAALPGGLTTSRAVYHAAAAEELLLGRERALATMRAAGVSVVNVAPTAMTAAVVNRYLDIKARAAL